MRPLLAVSNAIDLINEKIGYICNFLVLAACLVSAGQRHDPLCVRLQLERLARTAVVHVRHPGDVRRVLHLQAQRARPGRDPLSVLTERGQLWLDLIGTLFFLIPSCLLLSYLSWPFFHQAYAVGEMSGNAGGLIRWPIKFVIPSGFVMLALQGVSEVIKRIAALRGEVTIDAKYERPTQ